MADTDINARIAARVRQLRSLRAFTLDGLAERSGVSRSMISLIERGESSPTAVLLEKLATALGVTLAEMFDGPADTGPLARRAEQPVWKDPQSGYVRRSVSPPTSPIRIVEVDFPAGARVAYESGAREGTTHQQIWVQAGRIDVTLGRDTYRLDTGDCLAHLLDRPTTFHNPTRSRARYIVVLTAAMPGMRRA